MKNTINAAAPIECIQKGGDPEKTVIWACGSCKIAKESKEAALECCAPEICDSCGQPIEKNSYCKDCTKKKQHAQAQAEYDKAKKVMLSEYDGEWVCCDHCDEYYADVDSLLDAHDADEELPTWAWGTCESKFTLDAERIISDQLENQDFYEDAFENISGDALKELQTFLDTWVAKQEMTSYMVDNSVVVDFEALTNLRRKERDE